MSIYQLPHELIAIIIQNVPNKLHFVLKCIKFFTAYIGTSQTFSLVKYSAQCGYVNILREFLPKEFLHKRPYSCLWNCAIKNNQIGCLKLLIELGEKPTLHWKTVAAYYSSQIFIWLFDEYKSTGINRYDCQFRAIDAGNIAVLSCITYKNDRFLKLLSRAIEAGQLASVKFIAQLIPQTFRKNALYTTLAIYHAQADILNYLLNKNFVISARYVRDHLSESPLEAHMQHDEYRATVKNILISLAYKDTDFAKIASQF